MRSLDVSVERFAPGPEAAPGFKAAETPRSAAGHGTDRPWTPASGLLAPAGKAP